MSNRIIGLIIILFGAVVSIFSLLADGLGLGAHPEIIGWKQLAGSNAGIFISIVGLWFSQSIANGGKNKLK